MILDKLGREDFIQALRAVADAFDADAALPVPTISVSVHLPGHGETARQAFRAARRAFPNAAPTLGTYWVEMLVAPGVVLAFTKESLCTKRTEPRDVEVYDLDPELMGAVRA